MHVFSVNSKSVVAGVTTRFVKKAPNFVKKRPKFSLGKKELYSDEISGQNLVVLRQKVAEI
jgi:hypothetical protein